MSRDAQLAFPCPHIIGEERVSLDADRRTLYTSRPIMGTSVLKVVANDTYEVSPFTGVVSPANLKSYRKEPYRITLATRDLTVKTRTTQFGITLPVGYLTTDRIVGIIAAAQGQNAQVLASSDNGYLSLTEQLSSGPTSQIHLSGSALEPLGFDQQNGAKGQVVVPSWRVYSRSVINPQDAVDSLGYFIRFDAPIRQNFYYSVTYSVTSDQCLRCRATEVENDYRFDNQGEALVVENENLLYQSCLKFLLTELQSNIYYPWYGSQLASLIGGKVLGGTAAGIRQTVVTALQQLQNLQNKQANFQRITAKERLFSVDNVTVSQSPNDPTVFLIDVSVRNYASGVVNITIVYTTPGTFALPGTNRLSLGNFG